MNSTIAPVASSTFTPQTLYARADTSANVDRVITITTSVSLKTAVPIPSPSLTDNPNPIPRSVDAHHILGLGLTFLMQWMMAPVRPSPTERESDPELARVFTIHSELEQDAVELEPVR
ncbi:uncharacterized protein LAJ45_08919 [Morchella importuna]|uniref:uncharacterized protein n=1 Tax=Morchella importuna TaxID=1174673 RepID=UPI001E8DBE5E|nr:uncharacterized protein LAJ45_08919 [Morchella importuna]KAH8147119.1 hypothetical protein LAJ45_08919 [Morchella importuna]